MYEEYNRLLYTKLATYTINREPISLTRIRGAKVQMWDKHREAHLLYDISLTGQHNDAPLYDVPLYCDVTFYMTPPTKNFKIFPHSYHPYRPALDDLLKFLFKSATGIIFKERTIIASIKAQKRYDKNPRTVFTLYQFEKESDAKESSKEAHKEEKH